MPAADTRHEERDQSAVQAAAAGGRHTVLNWVLALLTIPGAVAVVAYSYLQAMSTAACVERACRLGPGELVFGLIMYGTPVVAVVAIVLSLFTARRPRGFVVPALAWAWLVIAALILALTFDT